MAKTRIINDKGEVRFVSDAVAADTKMLKSYGFRVEQPKREEVEGIEEQEWAVLEGKRKNKKNK
jgi:hypothetical protein